jgi:hypothetical protein
MKVGHSAGSITWIGSSIGRKPASFSRRALFRSNGFRKSSENHFRSRKTGFVGQGFQPCANIDRAGTGNPPEIVSGQCWSRALEDTRLWQTVTEGDDGRQLQDGRVSDREEWWQRRFTLQRRDGLAQRLHISFEGRQVSTLRLSYPNTAAVRGA